MRTKERAQGRFVSLSGFRKVAGLPDGRYELIIVDKNGQPVSHLCEWYRLRTSPGTEATRRTYLGFLQPFFAYLLSRDYAWNSEPERIRGYIKSFLLEEVACHVNRDTTLDGYLVELTGKSSLAQSSLRVLLAAIRDFYLVMREAGLYPFENPMCSALLHRWKQEHIKSLENAGAPDHAGIRSETRQETNTRPTAFFRQRRGKAWKPDVALTSERIQLRLHNDLDWMARHASTQRDRLIFLLLRYTGARLGEILNLTAGGYRKAKDPYQAYVTDKGSYGREEKLIHFTPAIEKALVRYVRTERAMLDPQGRKRLCDLDDTDPIFLTRRRTRYNRDAFYHHWRKLFAARPPQKTGDITLPLLEFTPHDIRHLRVTEWLTKIKKKCLGNSSLERVLRRGVQRRIAWRSPLTIECYDHSFTEQEDEEAFATFQCEVEQEAGAVSVIQRQTSSKQTREDTSKAYHTSVMHQALTDLAFWKDEA